MERKNWQWHSLREGVFTRQSMVVVGEAKAEELISRASHTSLPLKPGSQAVTLPVLFFSSLIILAALSSDPVF